MSKGSIFTATPGAIFSLQDTQHTIVSRLDMDQS
jgi:hypothetical protein